MTHAQKIYESDLIANTDMEALNSLRRELKKSIDLTIAQNSKILDLIDNQNPTMLGFLYKVVDYITISANLSFESKFGKKSLSRDDYIKELGLLIDSFYFLFQDRGFILFDSAIKIQKGSNQELLEKFKAGEDIARVEVDKLSKIADTQSDVDYIIDTLNSI